MIALSSDPALEATLTFPYAAYRLALFEALRKRDPIDSAEVPPGVVIAITPARIDSPDIIKVVVERDGRDVSPLLNLLKPTTLTTRLGAAAVLHSGAILYPCSAFESGARVRVVLIPERGSNVEYEIRPSEVAAFFPSRTGSLSIALLNLTATDLEAKIGKPTRVDGHRWTYEVSGDRLLVYLNDSNVVIDVQPGTFDLSVFKR